MREMQPMQAVWRTLTSLRASSAAQQHAFACCVFFARQHLLSLICGVLVVGFVRCLGPG